MQTHEEYFIITGNNKIYKVITTCEDNHCSYFKIETD
jgi:hypothetical protein